MQSCPCLWQRLHKGLWLGGKSLNMLLHGVSWSLLQLSHFCHVISNISLIHITKFSQKFLNIYVGFWCTTLILNFSLACRVLFGSTFFYFKISSVTLLKLISLLFSYISVFFQILCWVWSLSGVSYLMVTSLFPKFCIIRVPIKS